MNKTKSAHSTPQFQSKLPRPTAIVNGNKENSNKLKANDETLKKPEVDNLMASLQRIQSLRQALDELQQNNSNSAPTPTSTGKTPNSSSIFSCPPEKSVDVNKNLNQQATERFDEQVTGVDAVQQRPSIETAIEKVGEHEEEEEEEESLASASIYSQENEEFLQEYANIEGIISALNSKADKILERSDYVYKAVDKYGELKQLVEDVDVDEKEYKRIVKEVRNDAESDHSEAELDWETPYPKCNDTFIAQLKQKYGLNNASATVEDTEESIVVQGPSVFDASTQTEGLSYDSVSVQTIVFQDEKGCQITTDHVVESTQTEEAENEAVLVEYAPYEVPSYYSNDEMTTIYSNHSTTDDKMNSTDSADHDFTIQRSSEDFFSLKEGELFDFFDDLTEFTDDLILGALRTRLKQLMDRISAIDEEIVYEFI